MRSPQTASFVRINNAPAFSQVGNQHAGASLSVRLVVNNDP